MDSLLTRRQAIATLASTATVPLMSACNREPGPPASTAASSADSDAKARALLEDIGNRLLSLMPESATSLGLDTGARAELRSQLMDRSAEGQQRIASQLRSDRERANAFDISGLPHATRTSVEVVRSAYATALEGFAMPYGDVPVGGWRITPYVLIQNVGAYLDIPRHLDAEHRIENAADAEAYLARLQSYAKQADGELGRIQGVQFFVDVNGSNPLEVASEVDRYCSWPGQACGYKVGHSEINRQREKAKTTLASKFDDKAFDDTSETSVDINP